MEQYIPIIQASASLVKANLTLPSKYVTYATQSFMLAIEKPKETSMISVSTALIFSVILIILLWPLGLTGIWLNFAGASLLAGILAFIILYRQRGELMKDDIS